MFANGPGDHGSIPSYLLTEVLQSHKYYKSCALSVTSKVGLTTDRDLSVLTCLRNTRSFIPPRYRKSRGTSYYTTQCTTTLIRKSIVILIFLGLYTCVRVYIYIYIYIHIFFIKLIFYNYSIILMVWKKKTKW